MYISLYNLISPNSVYSLANATASPNAKFSLFNVISCNPDAVAKPNKKTKVTKKT